jgi:hypothetical protein
VLQLSGARIIGHSDRGAVRLSGAHISGNLDCRKATLRGDSGPALVADNLQVGQNVSFERFTAISGGVDGAVNLVDAHIGGSLFCRKASLHADNGPALAADRLKVDGSNFLKDSTATGKGEFGAIRLNGAHIGGQFVCTGTSLCNKSGPALHADGLQVDQHMFLSDKFTATGDGNFGAVSLVGAHIGGSLVCTGASLRNDNGPALRADGLHVEGIFRGNKFTATGAGEDGAVRLTGAHIGDNLDCDGAELYNKSGPALAANRLQVGQVIHLRDGFTATGDGNLGAVDLTGAHIGGSLHCDGAKLCNKSGPALAADSLQAGRGIYLTDGFTATGGGPDVAVNVAVNLVRAQVGGKLFFHPARLEHAAGPHRRLAADGLTYTGVPDQISARDWLGLLRHGTPSYAAQPYQQLAAAHRALGDERQTREILIAQRDDELARSHTRWPQRSWGRITKITLGYGYKPWRALLFLAGVVAISCLLAVTLGSHGALAQTDKTATPGQPCTVIQQVSIGLDLNLPVGTSLARAKCDLSADSASATAFWLTFAGGVLRVLAWVFAALFIAGFTSAVRKT